MDGFGGSVAVLLCFRAFRCVSFVILLFGRYVMLSLCFHFRSLTCLSRSIRRATERKRKGRRSCGKRGSFGMFLLQGRCDSYELP